MAYILPRAVIVLIAWGTTCLVMNTFTNIATLTPTSHTTSCIPFPILAKARYTPQRHILKLSKCRV